MKRTRLGLVGLGMAVTPHAQALVDLADSVEVSHAFSPRESRRQAFAARFPFPTCDRIETMLGDPSVDAVIVLTPPNTHLDIARLCAAAGKHILLEKPLEVTTQHARAVVEACENAGVALGVVLQHRFKAAVEEASRIVRSRALGDLVSGSASVRLWRPQSYYEEPGRGTFARDGGGVLITQAIHTLDLMLSLTGPVDAVKGYVTTSALHRMEAEDLVGAALRFANGAIGTIGATTAAFPGYPERIELAFTRGGILLSGQDLDVYGADGQHVRIAGSAAGGTGAGPMSFSHHDHRAVIADFVAAIREGRAPRVTGRDALAVHRLIDALIEAGRTEGSVRVAQS